MTSDVPAERAKPGSSRVRARVWGAVAVIVVAVGVAITVNDDAAPEPQSSSSSSAASAAPTSAQTLVLPMSVPVRLEIPAIGVDSELMALGLREDGSLEVPPEGFPAGWYTGAPTPGELGPAVIAGHVDWGGSPAVFYDLRDLVPGDEITIVREDGSTAVFRVTRLEQFPKDAFPTTSVYGPLDYAGLRLITCGGSFDQNARSYVDNIVAFAELIAVITAQ